MTLLALTAVICFGFAVYNLTCAFADIPTKRTSRMMLLARKQQGVKAEKLLDVYLTKIAGLIAPYLKLDTPRYCQFLPVHPLRTAPIASIRFPRSRSSK